MSRTRHCGQIFSLYQLRAACNVSQTAQYLANQHLRGQSFGISRFLGIFGMTFVVWLFHGHIGEQHRI